jgi:hypothetical protein
MPVSLNVAYIPAGLKQNILTYRTIFTIIQPNFSLELKNMKNSAPEKKNETPADDKTRLSGIVDEILAERLRLPDTDTLFSKIKELDNSTIDYTSVLSRRFSNSSFPEQEFMLNHLFPRLKRLSLSENLNTIAQRETLAPRIIVDILHYLIRSDTIINHQLLENANKAEEIVNQLSTLPESADGLESKDGSTLFNRFCEMTPSLQLGIIVELLHFNEEKTLLLLTKIFSTKIKIAIKMIDLLGSFANKKSAHLLHQLLKVTKDKELSKNIKKTLYRFKNKGIELPAPEQIETTGREKKKVPLPSPAAYVTTIDPLGERLLLAVKPKNDQELTIVQFLISDQKGMGDLIMSTTTSKEFKNYTTKLKGEKELILVEIDLAYCHFLVKESSRKNHASGTKIPNNYFLWKKYFNEYDSNLDNAMIYSVFNAEEIRAQELLLQQSEELIEKHSFIFWLLEWKLLIDCYKEIHELENSPLVLTEQQKESRTTDIVKKTTSLFFDDNNRLVFQRRLEDTAYILWKTGKEEEAKSAFAAALAFAPGGVPSEKHPFAIKTVEKNFNFLREQAKKNKEKEEEKKSESGNIVLP